MQRLSLIVWITGCIGLYDIKIYIITPPPPRQRTMARGVATNEAGDGVALRIQTLLPVARRGYGTVWIDCGELWALRGSHSRPKHAAALPSRGTPISTSERHEI